MSRHGRILLSVVVTMLAPVAAGGADEPPIPKEGSYTTLTMGSATFKRLDQGKDRAQTTWEFLGAGQGEDGKGLSHDATVRCLGSILAANGELEAYLNSCTWTRRDGDQIFLVEKLTSGKPGAPFKGTFTITGGTGKMAGITGGGEWTRYTLRPSAEGTFQSVTRGKTTYKLP
jgi:hypothetical protein